jgi:tripartite-type tricarboxylate transporter receptor subunit TctC
MKTLLGTVVVENIGGGGSSVGAAQAARARPDGYTILLGGATTHVTEALQHRWTPIVRAMGLKLD